MRGRMEYIFTQTRYRNSMENDCSWNILTASEECLYDACV